MLRSVSFGEISFAPMGHHADGSERFRVLRGCLTVGILRKGRYGATLHTASGRHHFVGSDIEKVQEWARQLLT